METKLNLLKRLMRKQQQRDALKLAASWPQLGEHKERITRGWAAEVKPQLYTQMAQVPKELVEDGIRAVCERYRLCILCGCELEDKFGHNAQPLARGCCCEDCNILRVIPARWITNHVDRKGFWYG